ncbi:hypothetical protein V6N13_114486 [Hibiscus sabdariffa]|uniref:Uncharacterized protein n=1 Tax=Hibiscus sabdariffa TaxID=183260 RepID=A0ABR2U1X1_9ROSI
MHEHVVKKDEFEKHVPIATIWRDWTCERVDETSRDSKFPFEPSFCGRMPLRLLFQRSKMLTFGNSLTPSEVVPEILLPIKLNHVSSVKEDIPPRIVPLSWLSDKSKALRAFKFM